MKVVVLTTAIFLSVVVGRGIAKAGASMNDSSPEGHFPNVKASNLAKRELSLPADLEGERNLLLVAFEREQQKDIDTWLRQMKAFETLDSRFRYYELPTIATSNSLTRWFIDNGMRRGIPDHQARERTITLYVDKKAFCNALLISDQKQIYAFLVDRTGKVLWRAMGDLDEVKVESLKHTIQDLTRR